MIYNCFQINNETVGSKIGCKKKKKSLSNDRLFVLTYSTISWKMKKENGRSREYGIEKLYESSVGQRAPRLNVNKRSGIFYERNEFKNAPTREAAAAEK